MNYNIAEKFVSINGEGVLAGQAAVFIRFCGCNLECEYCDTKWANTLLRPMEILNESEILDYIKSTGIKNVTLTGGEPLIQEGIEILIKTLAAEKNIHVEIETNGSVDISQFFSIENRPSFTVDYKLPGSGMESYMSMLNFSRVTSIDTVKFVVSDENDLIKANKIINKFGLQGKCRVFISPVFGKIEPVQLVEFLIKNKMNDVNIQLQLHKIIWNPDKRGV